MGMYRFYAKEYGWTPRQVDNELSLEEFDRLPMIEHAHRQAQGMLEEEIAAAMNAQR